MATKLYVFISEPTLLMVDETGKIQVEFSPYVTQNSKLEKVTLGMAVVEKDSPQHELVKKLAKRYFYKEEEIPPTSITDEKVLSKEAEDGLVVNLGKKRNDNKPANKQD